MSSQSRYNHGIGVLKNKIKAFATQKSEQQKQVAELLLKNYRKLQTLNKHGDNVSALNYLCDFFNIYLPLCNVC